MTSLSIVGAKNSGKTGLMEKLIARAAGLGLKVAAIKHTSHGHLFDTEGKDSYRHRQAGAETVLAVGQTEFALFGDSGSPILEKVKKTLSADFDIVLTEGDKGSEALKILLTKNSESPGFTMPLNVVATYGPVGLGGEVPHFETGDADGLVEFISEKYFPGKKGSVNGH